MYHARLMKEIEKIGLNAYPSHWNENYFIVRAKKYICSWYRQEDMAKCVHLQTYKQEQERDSQSDYFPGFFADTYKEVKRTLTEE